MLLWRSALHIENSSFQRKDSLMTKQQMAEFIVIKSNSTDGWTSCLTSETISRRMKSKLINFVCFTNQVNQPDLNQNRRKVVTNRLNFRSVFYFFHIFFAAAKISDYYPWYRFFKGFRMVYKLWQSDFRSRICSLVRAKEKWKARPRLLCSAETSGAALGQYFRPVRAWFALNADQRV